MRLYELHEGDVAELVCLSCAKKVLDEKNIKHELPLNYFSVTISVSEDVFGENTGEACGHCQIETAVN